MRLLTKKLRKALPPLYSTEGQSDPMVICQYFLPGTGWSWYGIEFDGEDLFLGYVVGLECELGYFRLSEISSVRGPLGLSVARAVYFDATPLSGIRSLRECRWERLQDSEGRLMETRLP